MTSPPCECEIKTAEIKAMEPFHFTELSGEVVSQENELYFSHRLHGIVDVPESSAPILAEGTVGRFQIHAPYGFNGIEVFVNRQNGFVQRIVVHRNRAEPVALGSKSLDNLVRASPPAPSNCAPRVATEITSRYQDCSDQTEFLKSVEAFYTVENGDVVNEAGSIVRSHPSRATTREQAREQAARHRAMRAQRAREMVNLPQTQGQEIGIPQMRIRNNVDRELSTRNKNILIAVGVVIGVLVIGYLIKRAMDKKRSSTRASPASLLSSSLRPGYAASIASVKPRGRRTARR